MRRVETGAHPDEVAAKVCEVFGVNQEALRKRRSVSPARLAAAVLLKSLTGLSQREIGQKLGLADGSGLGNLLAIAEAQMKRDRRFRRTVEKLDRNA
jgi:chromosomal replication initiation ATPase DnaA